MKIESPIVDDLRIVSSNLKAEGQTSRAEFLYKLSNDVEEIISKYAELEAASQKLFSAFVRYAPGGNHTGELWWKPSQAVTMAKRDEALDELADLLDPARKEPER